MRTVSYGVRFTYITLAVIFVLLLSFQFISIGMDADSAIGGFLETQSIAESKIPTNSKEDFQEEKDKAKEELAKTEVTILPSIPGQTEILNGVIVGTWPMEPRDGVQQTISSILDARDGAHHNKKGHTGTDVAYGASNPAIGDKKMKIRAITGGKIVRFSSTDQGGYGVYLAIEEPTTGVQFLYGHMQVGSLGQGITSGATVKEGQFLGIAGNTGASGGIHLHVSIIRNPGVKYAGTVVAAQGKQLDMLDPKVVLFKKDTMPSNGVTYTAITGTPRPVPTKP